VKDTTDLTAQSIEHAINCTLYLKQVDQKVYHDQCLIGPQLQELLAKRTKIIDQLEVEFLRVREQNLMEKPATSLASIEEIQEETNFFQSIFHCYDCGRKI
jgi:hypothetical protein